ncbi:NADH dehydrogenase 1 beta subcomplex subunit 3 [Scheffersomyces coipomensis]|uniref:NADH dehydrogenase 1 beta subcomplex subunit 3 n=1 Tax=Scheffersomyces coipomensis TaxID=1788519 RepID=UPI00315CA5E0
MSGGNPWAKRDAWRYEGQFTRINRFKNAFPGLGIAIVAFSGYLAYEKIFLTKDSHHEEHH